MNKTKKNNKHNKSKKNQKQRNTQKKIKKNKKTIRKLIGKQNGGCPTGFKRIQANSPLCEPDENYNPGESTAINPTKPPPRPSKPSRNILELDHNQSESGTNGGTPYGFKKNSNGILIRNDNIYDLGHLHFLNQPPPKEPNPEYMEILHNCYGIHQTLNPTTGECECLYGLKLVNGVCQESIFNQPPKLPSVEKLQNLIHKPTNPTTETFNNNQFNKVNKPQNSGYMTVRTVPNFSKDCNQQGEIRNKNGKCVCNDNYEYSNGQCVRYDNADNDLQCGEYSFIKDGKCECNNGYEEIEGKCQEVLEVICPKNHMLNKKSHQCKICPGEIDNKYDYDPQTCERSLFPKGYEPYIPSHSMKQTMRPVPNRPAWATIQGATERAWSKLTALQALMGSQGSKIHQK